MQKQFDYAEAFARALRDHDAQPPEALRQSPRESVARRFAINRNNVFSSLIGALEARFPVCRRLVGGSFFKGLAQEYVRRSPPASPVLSEYGSTFPDFASGFEPARELPYLPDVARLELDVGRACDAADAAPLQLQVLLSMAPDILIGSKLLLHPSMALRSSAHPIVSIWRTNSFDDDVDFIDATVAEDALVLRPYWNVEVHSLPAGGFHFIRSLAVGETLASASAEAQVRDLHFDLAACVRLLIRSGAIVAIEPSSTAIDS